MCLPFGILVLIEFLFVWNIKCTINNADCADDVLTFCKGHRLYTLFSCNTCSLFKSSSPCDHFFVLNVLSEQKFERK